MEFNTILKTEQKRSEKSNDKLDQLYWSNNDCNYSNISGDDNNDNNNINNKSSNNNNDNNYNSNDNNNYSSKNNQQRIRGINYLTCSDKG